MVCLETTFLIDLLKGREEASDFLISLSDREAIFVASPTVLELWQGALRARIPESEKEKVGRLLSLVNVLPLDERAAKAAAEIEFYLEKEAKMVDFDDILIAAIAITSGEKLITRDLGYGRIPNLRIETY